MTMSFYLIRSLVSCILLFVAASDNRYAIVIDAGSTGSRAFVVVIPGGTKKNDPSVKSIKGMKVTPGLSSFVNNPTAAVDYITPLFDDAASRIPSEMHQATPVYIKGTAGMRLLNDNNQSMLWDTLYDGLKGQERFPFLIERGNLGTIDGHSEAYYAVVASNYIEGSIDESLQMIDGQEMIGALDMGGSSTQLIYYTGSEPGQPIHKSNFWLHSWLNFGVEKIRERVWEHLLKLGLSSQDESDGAVVELSNPCALVGHEYIADGAVLKGSGQSKQCIEIIKEVIWSGYDAKSCQEEAPCAVDGVTHPPLSGRFYGMSVYFYAVDCIRQLGPYDFPNWYV